VRGLQFPLQVQLRQPSALLAGQPHEKRHVGGHVGGVVEVVSGLIDPPPGFALDPGDERCGTAGVVHTRQLHTVCERCHY
jgi:hypothetical protein